MKRSPHRTAVPAAFSLVEVTLALGIAVFCLVVVFGLLTVGINTSSVSVEQTNATNLLAAIANDLKTAPIPAKISPTPSVVSTYVYALPVPAPTASTAASPTPSSSPSTLYLDVDGQPVGQITFKARYQLNVWFTPGMGRNATMARVVLSWPAGSALASASGSVETLVALDRN